MRSHKKRTYLYYLVLLFFSVHIVVVERILFCFQTGYFISNKNGQLQLSENSNLYESYRPGSYISETEITRAQNTLCFHYYRLRTTTDEQIAQQYDKFLLRVLTYSRT